MSQENLETVRRIVDAWDRDDLDEAFAYLTAEVEFHTSGRFADRGVYRGRAGLDRFLTEWREDLEPRKTSVSDIRAVGEAWWSWRRSSRAGAGEARPTSGNGSGT